MNIIAEIFNDAFWYMAPILVTLSTTLTGVINQAFNVPDKAKQPISWGMGAVLSCLAIALGFLGENIGWESYVAMSAVVALSSNGIYDIEFIKNWIDKWFHSPTAKA
jgi:hypothetical protein